MPKTHELKCWPQFFAPLRAGVKQFEFRRDDRGFEVGDVLELCEWDPSRMLGNRYTGNVEYRAVTYVLRAPDAGVPDGFVVMSLAPLPK